ncbi:glycosyltransferase, partial [candidate division TA06 bacterium]|nr:glycosyltransferase [candidate division TA06 bacterium]
AKGRYIARMDAHAVYGKDYLKNCLEVMEATKADNVGGPALSLPSSKTAMAHSIVLAHLSPFGLGGGTFRNPNAEGWVETVWPGFYRREVFEKVGYLTFSVPRAEDIEFNARAREAGFKIYLSPKIKSYYYCRDTLKKIWIQRWSDGVSIARILKINPKAPRLRHFIPLIFISSLLLLSALALISAPPGSISLTSLKGLNLFNLSNVSNSIGLAATRLLLLELLAYFSAMLLAVIQAGKTKFTVYSSKFENVTGQDGNQPQPVNNLTVNGQTVNGKQENSTLNGQTVNCPLTRLRASKQPDPTPNVPTVNGKRSFGSLALLPVVFVTLHFSYGLGSLWGLISLPLFVNRKLENR